MQLLVSSDPTTLSYWLNWRVFVSAIWVLTSMLVASFIIWKYEHSDNLQSDEERTQQESSRIYDRSWKPCVEEIHPMFLMFFRLIAFCLLLVAFCFDVALHGFELFYYYTQWTFTLVTIYFGLGSLLSIHGCFHHLRSNSSNKFHASEDSEQGLYVPLKNGGNKTGVKLLESLDHPGKFHILVTSRFWGYLFQVLFQMTAGAVTITDLVYWCLIFPFITLRDYEMNFVSAYGLNNPFVLLFPVFGSRSDACAMLLPLSIGCENKTSSTIQMVPSFISMSPIRYGKPGKSFIFLVNVEGKKLFPLIQNFPREGASDIKI
ncbi:hypothetical protein BUALT_Bualt04G0160600 [Buddleja alternifolia]|uniref:Uncharacterized protein n=1 Tax=Buddleja alternifolia TaxID=168488 RepID=A0AAV6XWR1_9LAMI|nr:hypothetical protein BUALT_Bualt04G0160600 [Buddleja alternifolia]